MNPGTSWASDFRVIEADRGWLLNRFILFNFNFIFCCDWRAGEGTLKAYFG